MFDSNLPILYMSIHSFLSASIFFMESFELRLKTQFKQRQPGQITIHTYKAGSHIILIKYYLHLHCILYLKLLNTMGTTCDHCR